MSLGAFLDGHTIQYLVGAEILQSSSQDVARNAESTLEFLESAGAQKCLANNQDRPTFSDYIEDMAYRSSERIKFLRF